MSTILIELQSEVEAIVVMQFIREKILRVPFQGYRAIDGIPRASGLSGVESLPTPGMRRFFGCWGTVLGKPS